MSEKILETPGGLKETEEKKERISSYERRSSALEKVKNEMSPEEQERFSLVSDKDNEDCTEEEMKFYREVWDKITEEECRLDPEYREELLERQKVSEIRRAKADEKEATKVVENIPGLLETLKMWCWGPEEDKKPPLSPFQVVELMADDSNIREAVRYFLNNGFEEWRESIYIGDDGPDPRFLLERTNSFVAWALLDELKKRSEKK